MPNGSEPGSKVVALPAARGGKIIRALSEVCASVAFAMVPTMFLLLDIVDGYQPKGSGPIGENLATGVSVAGPEPTFLNSCAATSSVPASTPGSCCGVLPRFGLELFCAIPTFSL